MELRRAKEKAMFTSSITKNCSGGTGVGPKYIEIPKVIAATAESLKKDVSEYQVLLEAIKKSCNTAAKEMEDDVSRDLLSHIEKLWKELKKQIVPYNKYIDKLQKRSVAGMKYERIGKN
jgi:nitrate reductase assembly molybdenum cofactor insertion protein NarJ